MSGLRAAVPGVVLGVYCLASSATFASVIEYSLETSLDSAYGSLPAGTPITISFTYDDSQPDLVEAIPNVGAYDLLSLRVSAGAETALFANPIAAAGSLNILNATSPIEDDRLAIAAIVGTSFATTSGSLGGVPLANLQIDLLDASDSIFSGPAIPGPGLSAGDFTLLAGLLDDGLAIDQAPFSLLTSLTGQVVPEPSTALLLSVGLVGLGVGRPRR